MFYEILQIKWRIFLFWRNLKKEAATAILIMYIIYIINRAFLALMEPPKIRTMTKNFNAMLTKPRWIIWHHFWVDLGGIEITCTWVKMGRNSGPKYHTGQKAWHGKFLETGSRTVLKLKISKLLQYMTPPLSGP